MELLNIIFGTPLGLLMRWCYHLLDHYAAALLLFTVFTKVILLPLSLLAQRNSIKMLKLQPLLADINQRYEGNSELIAKEQKALYKRERYSTFIGTLPLLLQVVMVIGLINVIYNPLQHLLNLNPQQITLLADKVAELFPNEIAASNNQISMIEAIRKQADVFIGLPSMSAVVDAIVKLDFSFWGLDLLSRPGTSDFSVLIPILSGLSALALALVQNHANVLQREQNRLFQASMAIFMTIFSGAFAAFVPNAIGLYWIFGNVLSIPVTYLCNLIYDPKKYIDYSKRIAKEVKTKAERIEEKSAKRAARKRERQDSQRFFGQDKDIVFYSEGSGFYKYFASFMDYIMDHSDVTIHYVSSDINDQVFSLDKPQLECYYIGPQALIPFMMKMDAKIVVMTLADLERFHIKRSIVSSSIEYIYLDHGMSSFHLMLREGALDHYDTIFCYGPNHIEEVRQTEAAYGLAPKRLVKTGFPLLDDLLRQVANSDSKDHLDETAYGKLESVTRPASKTGEKARILIAPSWQADNIFDLCLDDLLSSLFQGDYHITLRPHPEYAKRFPEKLTQIENTYAARMGLDFVLERDFSSNKTVYTSDLIITDWSTIAHEFSYATKKPCLFINTPMKIMNPNYQKIAAIPLDISLRDQLGLSLDINDLKKAKETVDHLLTHQVEYHAQITDVMEENIYNIGFSAAVGGRYLLMRIEENRENAKQRDDKQLLSQKVSQNELIAK